MIFYIIKNISLSKIFFLTICILLILSNITFSQSFLTFNPITYTSAQLDSIENKLSVLTGSGKLDCFIKLAYAYKKLDPLKSIDYANKGLVYANEKNNGKEIAQLYTEIGKANNKLGNYTKEIEAHLKALKIRNELNDEKGAATSLNYLGQSYYDNENYSKSLQYFIQSVELFNTIGDKIGSAITYNDLGIVNYYLGNLESSLHYYLKSLKIKEELGNKLSQALTQLNIADVFADLQYFQNALKSLNIAFETLELIVEYPALENCLIKIGDIYGRMKNYDSALYYINKGLKSTEKSKNQRLTAFANMQLGKVYIQIKDLNKAKFHFEEARKIYESTYKSKRGILESMNQIGYIWILLGNYPLAIQTLDTALKWGLEIEAKQRVQDSYYFLFLAYKSVKKYDKSLFYHEKYSETQDSVISFDSKMRVLGLEAYYQSEKREKEIEALIREKQSETKIRNFLIVIVFLSILLLLVVTSRYFDKRKINKNLLEKNQLITQQKELLLKSEKELIELNATKDTFFSIIAHDLRSPFNGFLGWSQVLSEDISSFSHEKIQEIGIQLFKSSTTVFELLENLLNWSQTQKNTFPFNPTKINFNNLVNNCFELLHTKAYEKNIELINFVDPKLEITADKEMMSGLVRNLLTNSIKFNKTDGKVTIKAVTKDKTTLVSIEDSGIGMSEELKKNLFRIGEKVSRKGTNDESGTGLGLLLCKDFIDKHNGKIWVESVENEGSTFYFTIPENL